MHEKRVVGIIAEYNPFHNGHLYHLQEAVKVTEADFTIAVMSGDFLQRGEPAICDKWIRAEAAVRNGVDVVFELPFAFACNSAEYFAYGAVRLLDRLGFVSHLAFGSECAQPEMIKAVATVLAGETDGFKTRLKEYLDKGLSYPKARYEALKREMSPAEVADILLEPNNILAVEYVKQLIRQSSSMLPVAITRYKTGYKDREFRDEMASATAIREALVKQRTEKKCQEADQTNGLEKIRRVIPEETYEILAREGQQRIFTTDMLFPLLQYKIVTTTHHEVAKIFSIGEGLEHKIAKEIRGARSYRELVRAVMSKRYTQTRVQRAMIHLLMDFRQADMGSIMDTIDHNLYGRILACSQKGRLLLSGMKKEACSKIPIYTNINRQASNEQHSADSLLHYDILAADLYHIMAGEDIYCHSDFVKKPYIANERQAMVK